MPSALYYPFSRCLDDVALKRAVLLYDRLLFVDPVEPAARADLYLREGPHAGSAPDLAPRWQAAEADYELLAREGLVETVKRTDVRRADALEVLAPAGLELDLKVNRSSTTLFRGMHRWEMLESRVPRNVLQALPAIKQTHAWAGPDRIVHLPYAVGASLALTNALIVAHQMGATLITDHTMHHRLLSDRLQSAALDPAGVPGVYTHVDQPYLRRQVALRISDSLAPSAVLKQLSMEEVVAYRLDNEPQRVALNALVEKLTHEAQSRPWSPDLDRELDDLAERAREIALGLPGAKSAFNKGMKGLTKPSSKVKVVGATTVAALVAPATPLLAGLAAAGLALYTVGKTAFYDVIDELARDRTPEENGVAYLIEAGKK